MKTVAIIGASPNRRKFGNKALRAFRQAGYRAIPITPQHAEVEGVRAYASVLDVPENIDIATLYVLPAISEKLINEFKAKGIGELWINPGAESAALVAKAKAAGIRPILQCSILAIGLSPSQF